MKIPTDLDILNTIYTLYYPEFCAYNLNEGIRDSKVYVPIECKKIAKILNVDNDIVFGRLYYHLDKKYGYKRPDGSNVHFFSLKVGNDSKCVNFPLMSSVLAGMRQERRNFRIGTSIAILALIVSTISLTLTVSTQGIFNKNLLTEAKK